MTYNWSVLKSECELELSACIILTGLFLKICIIITVLPVCLLDGIETLDSGWLTCQTEIRLRLHYSEKPPVSITKKKFKKSRFRYDHVYLLLRSFIFISAIDY